MISLKKIVFPVLLFAFISFFLGHDIVDYCYHEKGKIENTAGSFGSLGFCTPENSAEEDVSFFVQYHATQSLNYVGKNLSSPDSILPPKPYSSIWLPPDNS